MSAPRVISVAAASPAARAGIEVGDELVDVDGSVPRDVIAYRLLVDEPDPVLRVRRRGHELDLPVAKAGGEALGAEVSSAVFDRVKTCDNHCAFCFIYQLPKGMRRSLYLKDDDYRLSFLYGNFTTLTRFTELDLERVVRDGLSPLHVSIHTTDPELRATMLRNRRGAVSLRWLRALLDAGVTVHGQIVVCPGVNDGAALEGTMAGILDGYPELASVACVPLGISRFSTEPDMRPHTPAEAADVLDIVHRWQGIYRSVLGRRLVHAGDEYYLLAGQPFPSAAAYEGLVQYENGVGMAAAFRAAFGGRPVSRARGHGGFFAAVDGAPAAGYRAPRLVPAAAAVPVSVGPSRVGPRSGDAAPAGGPAGHGLVPAGTMPPVPVPVPVPSAAGRPVTGQPTTAPPPTGQPVTVLTGVYGAQVLEPVLAAGGWLAPAGPVHLRPVVNDHFGGTIAVTGLLTGVDVARALIDVPVGHRVLLPDVCLSNGRFLDDMGLADLPRPVEVVPADGGGLRAALEGRR